MMAPRPSNSVKRTSMSRLVFSTIAVLLRLIPVAYLKDVRPRMHMSAATREHVPWVFITLGSLLAVWWRAVGLPAWVEPASLLFLFACLAALFFPGVGRRNAARYQLPLHTISAFGSAGFLFRFLRSSPCRALCGCRLLVSPCRSDSRYYRPSCHSPAS